MTSLRKRRLLSLRVRLGSLVLMSAIVLGLNSCANNDARDCYSPPHLSSISPNAATAGGPEFTITVKGNSFYVNSVVQWNEGNRQTTVVSASELTAVITADDIASAGTAEVRVETPMTFHADNLYCFGDSAPLPFAVNP